MHLNNKFTREQNGYLCPFELFRPLTLNLTVNVFIILNTIQCLIQVTYMMIYLWDVIYGSDWFYIMF